MYPPPSSQFLAALSYSHTVATEVVLIRTDGTEQVLDHTGGSVTADRSQATRRTCSVTLAGTALIPRTPADKLSVYGATLRISRGLYLGGQPLVVPLGRFRITAVSGDVDIGPVTIAGSSFEAALSDDPFESAVTVSSGDTAVFGIAGLIQATLPTAVIISTATDMTVGTRTLGSTG